MDGLREQVNRDKEEVQQSILENRIYAERTYEDLREQITIKENNTLKKIANTNAKLSDCVSSE